MSQPMPNPPQENPDAPPQGTPPAPQQGNPAPAPPADPAPAPRRIGGDNPFSAESALRSIHDSLGALPEKIVDAVREVTPAAPVVQQQANNGNPAQDNGAAKKRTFADWWFGK